MCFRAADFRVGRKDVRLGVIEGCPFYIATAHFRDVASCQLCIDVVDGGGDSLSIEAADSVRFSPRSRLFDAAEAATLAVAHAPRCGPSTGSGQEGTTR